METLRKAWQIWKRIGQFIGDADWPGSPDFILLYFVRALCFGCAVFWGPTGNAAV